MVFSSLIFLFVFLPLTLLLYYITPGIKGKNIILTLFSVAFYAWGEPVYFLLMILCTYINYIAARFISSHTSSRRPVLIFSLVISLGFLAVFKYAGLIVETLNHIPFISLPVPEIALPIGISFYTFQSLSYTLDIYSGREEPQKRFVDFLLYVSLFPQLIAGPILRYRELSGQLVWREHTLERFFNGSVRFSVGLLKKIVIADHAGEISLEFLGGNTTAAAWYGILMFAIQIYFDFSGYSDMAIGLGRMFGFNFLENFNYPFISKTATEFWRRWHMSLGSWFRDYVYIPLGGNRTSKARHLFNILVVWALTGVWHGADWNFILWGLMFAVILALEKFVYGKKLEKIPVLSHVYMFVVILISFVVFDATAVYNADGVQLFSAFDTIVARIGGMFGAGGIPLASQEALYNLRSYGFVIILAILGSTPLVKSLVEKIKSKEHGGKIINVLTPITVAALLLVVTAYLADGSFNPFLYFRF